MSSFISFSCSWDKQLIQLTPSDETWLTLPAVYMFTSWFTVDLGSFKHYCRLCKPCLFMSKRTVVMWLEIRGDRRWLTGTKGFWLQLNGIWLLVKGCNQWVSKYILKCIFRSFLSFSVLHCFLWIEKVLKVKKPNVQMGIPLSHRKHHSWTPRQHPPPLIPLLSDITLRHLCHTFA